LNSKNYSYGQGAGPLEEFKDDDRDHKDIVSDLLGGGDDDF
jgi:hypothetical protein